MKLDLFILTIGLTVAPGVFSAPVTLNPSDEALSTLTKRYPYAVSCTGGWTPVCVNRYDTYCDYNGFFFSQLNVCYGRCRCNYVGITPCRGCNVEEGSTDTVQETGTAVTDGKAQATGN